MKKLKLLNILFMGLALNACSQNKTSGKETLSRDLKEYPQAQTVAYWKKVLSAPVFDIMVDRGTEPPYKNPFWDNHKKGTYVSVAIGKPLFSSDAKFESGTGWPSFLGRLMKKRSRLFVIHLTVWLGMRLLMRVQDFIWAMYLMMGLNQLA